MYFRTADEANDWLAFDTSGQEIEDASYAENDRFAEWEQWRRWVSETALPHTCPFKMDVGNGDTTECYCSPWRQSECAADI